MVRPIFVTGIDTGIGKTIVSATVVQALGADYWKPVQAGDLEHSDTMRVRSLVTCPDVTFHPERFGLKHPMSPHAAAELDGVTIHLEDFAPPTRQKLLVVEGAGGLLVPLNTEHVIGDLIRHLNSRVLVVSKNYLGSINHTLLTIDWLRHHQLEILGIVFNGEANPSSETIIQTMTGIPVIGRIPQWDRVTPRRVETTAAELRRALRERLRTAT